MVALCNRADHYIFILWFLSSIFFFFLAWSQWPHIGCLPYFDTWCGPSANLECRSETCCTWLTENAGHKKIAKNWPSGHHPTTLSGYIFATNASIDNRKKNLLSSNISSTSPQYGELRPTSGWDRSGSLGHSCKFQRVSRLGSVTARHLVVGVSQTLRRWTEGAHILVFSALTLFVGWQEEHPSHKTTCATGSQSSAPKQVEKEDEWGTI